MKTAPRGAVRIHRSSRPLAAILRRRRAGAGTAFDERANIHGDANAPARIVGQARDEFAAAIAVAHVVARGDVAHFLDGAATLDFTGTALDFDRLRGGGAGVLAIDLVAH